MMGGGAALPSRFEEQYHCYSAAVADKAHLEVRAGFFRFPSFACLTVRTMLSLTMQFRLLLNSSVSGFQCFCCGCDNARLIDIPVATLHWLDRVSISALADPR